MEDYKKKYENLLHDIDIAIAGQKEGETKIVLQNIKERNTESEDERIRKGIIRNLEYLMDRAEGSVKEELQRRIDWLEEQGVHANFRNKIQIGDEVTRNEDGVLVNLSQFKRMVKQGKQKPIEWNADDLLKRNQIITILKEYNRTDLIAWLEKIHMDYRGLIHMVLALEAPEDMYK